MHRKSTVVHHDAIHLECQLTGAEQMPACPVPSSRAKLSVAIPPIVVPFDVVKNYARLSPPAVC